VIKVVVTLDFFGRGWDPPTAPSNASVGVAQLAAVVVPGFCGG
jgi:hypothetical protein